jgi:hypothetical protein
VTEADTHTETLLFPPKTRVAIVSGSFRMGYSYQENVWAERLAARGLVVRVFCAELGHDGAPVDAGYSVQSVPTRGIPLRNLYFERSVGQEVARFQPALILWFGPPQLFGRSLLKTDLGDVPLITFMGQNRRMQAFDWSMAGLSIREKAQAAAYRLVRGRVIAQSCERADLVVANTQETPDILALYLKSASVGIMDKIKCFPLGFDPETFVYDHELRAEQRAQMGLNDEQVLAVISSRFVPEKEAAINEILAAALEVLGQEERLHLALVGLSDNAVSQRVSKRCRSHPAQARIHLYPFAGREGLARRYLTGDVAIFAQPSISCQEALGTGIFTIFADDGSMDWLISCSDDGAFYRTGDIEDLSRVLDQTIARLSAEALETGRTDRAERATRLSYDEIIDSVLAMAGSRITDSRGSTA